MPIHKPDKHCNHNPHCTLTVKTRLGEMVVYDFDKYKDQSGIYCEGQDDISRTLINTGCWDWESFKDIKKLLKKGNKNNLIIDVGSHIGWYSKMAGNLGYRVDAFDAVKEHLSLLKINAPSATQHLEWFDERSVPTFETNRPIELLKIDVEGNEQYAIRYFEKCLAIIHNIIIEVSPIFNSSYPSLIEELRLKGFKVFEMDGESFNFDYNFQQKDLWLKRI